MKIQEAINCIDDVLNSDYHYDESLGYQLTSDDFEWLEKAKEELEKQVPKRPIEDGYYDEPAVCPNCGCNVVKFVDNYCSIQFCHFCGQKFDLSDHPTEKSGEQE